MISEEIASAVKDAETALQRARTNAALRRLGVGVGTLAERRAVAETQWRTVRANNAEAARGAREHLAGRSHYPKLTQSVRLAIRHPDLFDEFLMMDGLGL